MEFELTANPLASGSGSSCDLWPSSICSVPCAPFDLSERLFCVNVGESGEGWRRRLENVRVLSAPQPPEFQIITWMR